MESLMNCSRQDSVATPVDTETPRCQVSKKFMTLTLDLTPFSHLMARYRLHMVGVRLGKARSRVSIRFI